MKITHLGRDAALRRPRPRSAGGTLSCFPQRNCPHPRAYVKCELRLVHPEDSAVGRGGAGPAGHLPL